MIKSYLQIAVLPILAGALVILPELANLVQASPSTNRPETLPQRNLLSLKFEAPDDDIPKTNVGGGIRGNVQFSAPRRNNPNTNVGGGIRGEDQLTTPRVEDDQTGGATALLPPTQYGRTISARPTIFVYLPPNLSQEVFFSIQDEGGNPHYQTRIPVTGEGGIVSIELPEDSPELEMGKNYLWFLAPIEPGSNLSDNEGVVGWVKRVEATTVKEQNGSTSPLEQANAYAKSGIWYDTLDIMVEARRVQPENQTLALEWQELLEQVGLEELGTQPFAQEL